MLLYKITKIELGENEKLILKTKQTLDADQWEVIGRQFEKTELKDRVIIIEGDWEITKISIDQLRTIINDHDNKRNK